MLSNKEIILNAHQRIEDALAVTTWWRANEVRDNYNLIEGDQWLEEPYDRQNADGMPIRTINKLAPVIDAVSGFEIQNRTEIEYIPRIADNKDGTFSDILNDVVDYIESDSQSAFHNSQSFKDMLICGVGVTDTTIVYDNNPDGEVKIERIFPYFVLWDVTSRAKNLEDANWVIRAKIVDKDSMEGLLKDAEDKEEADATFGASVDARFLDFFNTVMIAKSLGIIYEYQWREKKTFYRIENPLINFQGNPFDEYTIQIIELAKTLEEKYKVNISTERIFSIEKEDYSVIKKLFEELNLPFKAVKQKKYHYYRATIVGNQVIDKSENFSQTGFSLKFMTGKFSEVRQCYYGMIRAAKEAQRLLNQAVSDYEGFLRTIPKGGVEIEADAVPNMQAFIQTYTKAREVTIYNPGGLSKTRPKMTPPIPSGLLDMINFATTAIMETTGVTQDFMGIADSKLMTATLNRQMVRQGLTVLSTYFDAKKFYMINQGKLFIDCVRVLIENSEGRLIRVTKNNNATYIPLLQDQIAAEYDVLIEETPQTPNEREQTFEKLLQMAQILMNKQNPVDITPLILQYSPLPQNDIEKIQELMKPPPPQQPDPVTQQILIAEAQLKEAEALKIKMEAMAQQQELETLQQQNVANIQKTAADTQFTHAKAAVEINKLIPKGGNNERRDDDNYQQGR